MYVPKPDLLFQAPASSQQIWRYMDLPKFISLLDKRALFFASAATLDDPYEARQPDAAMKDLLEFLEHPFTREHLAAGHHPPPKEIIRLLAWMDVDNRRDVGVNCWHCNEGESAAMWDLYASRQGGVMIQSTFGAFCESFNHSVVDVLAGLVQYGETRYQAGTLGPCMNKRKSFEHERELRSVVYPLSNIQQRTGEPESLGGTYVPVHLDQLIEKVLVAPLALPYYLAVVRSVATRFDLNCPVEKSPLYDGPLY
jgi:hypothetical protein